MAGRDDIPQPENREAESRFVITMNGAEANLIYDRGLERLVLVHTDVPESLEGHGVGGVLVRAAIDFAAEQNLVVVPRCPYARHWLKQHPEVAELVEIEWPPLGVRTDP